MDQFYLEQRTNVYWRNYVDFLCEVEGKEFVFGQIFSKEERKKSRNSVIYQKVYYVALCSLCRSFPLASDFVLKIEIANFLGEPNGQRFTQIKAANTQVYYLIQQHLKQRAAAPVLFCEAKQLDNGILLSDINNFLDKYDQ